MARRTVTVGSTDFRLVTGRKAWRRFCERHGRRPEAVKGLSSHEDAAIGLDPAWPAESRRATLLHEVLHMSLSESGLRLGELLAEVRDPEEVEERVVRALTGPLMSFLRRNPGLVDWLRDGA